jgi:predicted secreted protein with PEFG-CTERM motif
MKSYFDTLSSFYYNPEEKIVTFEMPFDWSEKTISHIPFVHEEVHFQKDFTEFTYPSYVGKVNGIELFKSSVTIDDYTEESERIVHFVLLQDHLRFLKNELKKSGEEFPDKMTFTLSTSDETQFPMIAMTRNEQFQVDLSWDPLNVEPGKPTKFIFTIRDGATGAPLRQSSYDFVIIQGGQEIHRASGNAQVGGFFEDYTFSEGQTGPTIIRFENIRDSGNSTEFGLVVVPEFGPITILIFVIAMSSMFVLSKKNFLNNLK